MTVVGVTVVERVVAEREGMERVVEEKAVIMEVVTAGVDLEEMMVEVVTVVATEKVDKKAVVMEVETVVEATPEVMEELEEKGGGSEGDGATGNMDPCTLKEVCLVEPPAATVELNFVRIIVVVSVRVRLLPSNYAEPTVSLDRQVWSFGRGYNGFPQCLTITTDPPIRCFENYHAL